MEKNNTQPAVDIIADTEQQGKVVQTYREVKIRNTIYRVTSIYRGKFELGPALEDLTVRKVLQAIEAGEKMI